MKKAIYLSILAIVTAGCILWRVGGGIGSWFHRGTVDAGETVTVDHETLDDFTELDMNVDVLDVTIQAGEDYSISYSAKEKYCPVYEVKNGKLVVTQSVRSTGWHTGNNVSGPSEVTLTIPEDVLLKNVDIVSNVGNVNIDGIKTERFSAELDVGDMEISDAALGDGTVDADVGNVCLRTVDFGNLNVDADVGDVKISAVGNKESYRIGAVADVGSISIDGEKVKENPGAGSDVQTGKGEYDLDVDADVGSIDLTFGN